jgi:hypothetical protein
MFEWNNPFKKHDLQQQFRFWLQKEVKNLEDLHELTGRLNIWDQRRLDVLKEMNERMAYGGERSAFYKLDRLSQIELNERFPGFFDDPVSPGTPGMPEPKPWHPLDPKPSPPAWKPGMPEPKAWGVLGTRNLSRRPGSRRRLSGNPGIPQTRSPSLRPGSSHSPSVRHRRAPAVVRRTDSNNPRPPVGPSRGSTACSGWGMRPTTLPAGLRTPAMSDSEPLGLWPGA